MDGTLLDVSQLGRLSQRIQFENQIRARAQLIYAPGDQFLCRILGRYKFYVDGSDVGFGAHIALDGYWEFWITQFIIRHLAEGTTVMDIGANHGYYSLVMADLVGPAGKVICVEPYQPTRQLLERNIAINGFGKRATIDGRAVADSTGRHVRMVCPPNEPKNAHIEWGSGASGYRAGTTVEVETVALDDMKLNDVDFMKVDIEGAEERMWRGMQRFLDRNRAVRLLLEFNYGRCEDPRRTLGEIEARYKLRHVDVHSQVAPITANEIMSAPPVDWMLYLSERDPLAAFEQAPPPESAPESTNPPSRFRMMLRGLGIGGGGASKGLAKP